jgi:hypothetical protein
LPIETTPGKPGSKGSRNEDDYGQAAGYRFQCGYHVQNSADHRAIVEKGTHGNGHNGSAD